MKKILITIFLIAVSVFLIFVHLHEKKPAHSDEILLFDSYNREAYLNLNGWDVSPVSEKSIIIPLNFDEIYSKYAIIQKKQKLPLENYKGKKATRYLYNVNNYNGKFPVYAELLIVDNRLVAAALIEQKPDGFIKELY